MFVWIIIKNVSEITFVQILKEENDVLSTELKTTKERTAGEGEECPTEVAVCVETKQATLGAAIPANL